ncbi:APC family permease [Falsarthrobacter nasiphocae]|uniref:APA family basic amino acid/polyamine antiporter n=1 Tax=Falsarthrobacter nasiphocae TaxID=189863 RepID=A0AAE4C6Q8_9MICC|nr:APC family permease [Falsarthrobacter nasiphocae]MDR6892417.1 APA family basic amino acid/polyamine antiporter [Falsarthrobacter nasiphocae]
MSVSEPRRVLGAGDAALLGVGSMLGAGVFTVFGPAAASAGTWLLAAVLLAGAAAFMNATSTAQLAAQYPSAGGAFVYGRERLGPWAGFVAGWGFVTGKTASCAAMALVIAESLRAAGLVPDGWTRVAAAAAVIGVALLNLRGVTKTAGVTRVLVGLVLAGLGAVLLAAWLRGEPEPARALPAGPLPVGGVLQAAGLMFFAFAGYARIATLAAEVREPRRTIPRAVVTALGFVVALYAVLAATLLAVLGPSRLAGAAAPLALLAGAGAADGPTTGALPVWIGLLGAVSAAGALLGLMAGLSRTGHAMAEAGELPRWIAPLDPRTGVPARAELVFTGLIVAAVLLGDLRGVIGFSSFGVLVYYLVANLAAWTQSGADRIYPRWMQAAGAVCCAALAVSLPWEAVLGGAAVAAVGVGVRLARLRAARTAA